MTLGAPGVVTATVTDAMSGPAKSTVSVPADVGSAGRKTARLNYSFSLTDSSNNPVPDGQAQALANACGAKSQLGPIGSDCATYSAATHNFSVVIGVPSSTHPKDYPLSLTIKVGSQIVNRATDTVTITK